MPSTKKDLLGVRLNNAGQLIYQAACSGELEKLELVFNSIPEKEVKRSINFRDSTSGMTPLSIAAKKGSLGCVKLLLYHGADVNHSVRHKLQNHKAFYFAKKAGHLTVEQYLRKCSKDFERLKTTRARLELTVLKVVRNPNCTLADRKSFDECLRELMKSCDYDLKNPSEETENKQPLVIQAARVDNIPIVLRLIRDFKVNEQTHDVDTAETLMHIACQAMSKLRFHLVHHYPSLLRKRDVNGVLPLHIACKNNDVEFISWLFQNIIAAEDRVTNELSIGMDVKRTRSQSDLVGPSVSINPNQSITTFFPVSPVEFPTTKSSIRTAGHNSTDGSRGSGKDINECDSAQRMDPISPLALLTPRDQALTGLSFDSTRSCTISVTDSSRSGSSEPHFPAVRYTRRQLHSSVSSDEPDTGDTGRSSRQSEEVKIFLTGNSLSDEEQKDALDSSDKAVLENGSDATGEMSSAVEPEFAMLLNTDNLTSVHSLSIADIVDTKPFSIDVNGDSIFHILAREGNSETLRIIIKVAAFLKHQVDLSILTHREGFSSRLPIEEAICVKDIDCVRLLINLCLVAGLMPAMLQDPHILRVAVITSDIRLVHVLVESGFHKGLKPAISLAIISEYHDILRLLLFWHTQVVNSTEFSRLMPVQGRRLRRLDRGVIEWEEIQLESIREEWLKDCCVAVTSSSNTLRYSSISTDITAHNFSYFQRLGRDCLQYFKRPSDLTLSLVPITELNISENQLSSVPMEIFQMPSLQILRLSQNKLSVLPSSDDPFESVYTSSLIKLHLDGNQLTSLPEDLFRGTAGSLRELNVQYNNLQALPPSLWMMPKLRKIVLAHNKLERLHYFSFPSYYNDMQLSQRVTSSFTVDDDGSLTCSNEDKKDTQEIQQCESYLRKLAVFYHMVCSTRCPQGRAACAPELTYQEMINIHLARYTNFTSNSETTAPVQNSAKILSLFEEEEFGSLTECTMEIDLLDLSDNNFKEFPWDLACISPNLKKLDIRDNAIQQFDVVHSVPRNILSLIAVNNKISALRKERSINLPCGNPLRLLCVQDDVDMDCYCQHCRHPALDKVSNLILDHNHLCYFPIVDKPRLESSSPSSELSEYEVINCDTYYRELSILSLAHNKFTAVPKNLHRLRHLSSLTLSHNKITELPLEMGLMNSTNLLLLKLDGMFLRNVPDNLLEKHLPKKLLNFLKSLQQKSRAYRRMKLMVVGGANKGKTSLLLNLVKRGRMKRFTEVERGVNDLPLATVGVELGDWEYSHGGKPKVTFMTWDFGGQEEYYATHQCFLTRRSLYLLLWNVKDGEEGLRSLKPWLENIEGRAPKSPVIVVGTHIDLLPQAKRNETLGDLQAKFVKMYVQDSHRKYTYPCIYGQCQFINVNSPKYVDSFRDFVYDFAIQYRVPDKGSMGVTVVPLLDEPIPESFSVLQDVVRETAELYVQDKKKPILTRKEYIQAIRDSDYSDKIKESDIDQATSFLHDSGILLHYEDSSLLNDLYFINPQWLCSMLAKLITIKENNPFQRQGFMLMSDVRKIYTDCFTEVISLMQKFEVVLALDEHRLLIPSLLPLHEEDSCLIFSRSLSCTKPENMDNLRNESHAPMYETPHPIITRYYLLPFVPNGFFSRLMARLMSGELIDHLQKSLISNISSNHIINSTHWKCWRTGILVTWSHMEIFRIAPISSAPCGVDRVGVVTKKDTIVHAESFGGLEIKVAMLPEEFIEECSTLRSQLSSSACSMEPEKRCDMSQGQCLATWLLHQATMAIDSVFEDWYESFARKQGFDPHQENVRITNPCNKCSENVRNSQLLEARHLASSIERTLQPAPDGEAEEVVCYVFTSSYISHVAAHSQETLMCPSHGALDIADVAPDLVFCDFVPGTVFTDVSSLSIRERLGDGGFGTVYRATLHTKGRVETVAAKRFAADMGGYLEHDPDIMEQLKSWDIYQKASLEARVMHQLSHPNILGLVGVALHPLSLLVELAPLGDLKGCVDRFRREKARLNRKTLKCTLIQVAEALNYLHSRSFIYRDLKPENVLVWKFPRPENQSFCEGDSVYLKVADYGISKQITPQGIRGLEGTRPYLPPEVILHGGREAYSTKLDVYAFGMFIYYLVSFRTPFDSGRPVTALLEEGKRPELPLKHRPHSLQLFELMCWCWSDRPRHRPDFNTVLDILKTDMFTHLLASFPLLSNEEEVTTSCVRLCRGRRLSQIGSLLSHSTMMDQSVASLGVMSLVNGRTAAGGNETCTQVWYGTEFGKFGVIQFQSLGITHEDFALPEGKTKFISTIKLIRGKIWVATVGNGLLLFEPVMREILAHWGKEGRYQVYTFMELEESEKVLVFTHRGVFLFESEFDLTALSDDFVPILDIPRQNEELNIGLVIPRSGNMKRSEVWAASLSGQYLFVMSTENYEVVETVPLPKIDKRLPVRHMKGLEVNDKPVLAVANKHMIHLFNVEERTCLPTNFNCKELCSHIKDTSGTVCRVASLTAKDHFLYAAVKGIILCLNCETMEVVKSFNAYRKAVRSLLLINYSGAQSMPFDRLVSRMSDSSTESPGTSSLYSPSQKYWSGDSRKSSLSSLGRLTRVGDSFDRDGNTSNSILVSFGVGFNGIVKDCHTHPEDFLLPSEGSRKVYQPACPDRTTGRLLLWSTETCVRREPIKGEYDIPELDEEEVMVLPDDVVTGYQ